MSRQLTNALLAQMYSNFSEDPFLTLLTLDHSSFSKIYLVNNSLDVVSNGETYQAFPFDIVLPVDDGESDRRMSVTADNVSLELMTELRSVTDPIDVSLSYVLASDLDNVEFSFDELILKNVTYNKSSIQGLLVLDDFLNTEMTSESYTPSLFPGIFQ